MLYKYFLGTYDKLEADYLKLLLKADKLARTSLNSEGVIHFWTNYLVACNFPKRNFGKIEVSFLQILKFLDKFFAEIISKFSSDPNV